MKRPIVTDFTETIYRADAYKYTQEQEKYIDYLEAQARQLILSGVGSSLPDLQECNQAALDYADKKGNPDFFLIKQVFKEGVNWALNKVVKTK